MASSSSSSSSVSSVPLPLAAPKRGGGGDEPRSQRYVVIKHAIVQQKLCENAKCQRPLFFSSDPAYASMPNMFRVHTKLHKKSQKTVQRVLCYKCYSKKWTKLAKAVAQALALDPSLLSSATTE